jgi:hypothetical protein
MLLEGSAWFSRMQNKYTNSQYTVVMSQFFIKRLEFTDLIFPNFGNVLPLL